MADFPPGIVWDWYRRQQGALNPQTPQAFEFLLQVLQRVVFVHVMGFEESVELVPVSKTEQPPQLGLSDVTALEFLECQGFEGAAREIGTGRAHAAGEIVGNLDGEIHALSHYPIPRTRELSNAR